MKLKTAKIAALLIAVSPFLTACNSMQAERVVFKLAQEKSEPIKDTLVIDNSELINPEGNLLMNFIAKPTIIHPIQKKDLAEAELLQDLISAYPSKYIEGYIEVRLSAQNKVYRSKGDLLLKEQKQVLQSLRTTDKFTMEVDFWSKAVLGQKLETKNMTFEITVAPALQAYFSAGDLALNTYFRERCLTKQNTFNLKELENIKLAFTVNKEGEVVNPHLEECYSDIGQTEFLINSLMQMPAWEPAKNEAGESISQEFYLDISAILGC